MGEWNEQCDETASTTPRLSGSLIQFMFFLWQSFIPTVRRYLCNRRRMVFCDGLTHHVYYLRNEY